MKSVLYTGFLIGLVNLVMAQSSHPVAEAERAFAARALSHGMKQAFLDFMDTASIQLAGEQVGKAYPFWQQAPETPVLLLWRPEYFALSSNGTLGFTTGPYEMRRHKNDSLTGRAGQYTSIWHKPKDGKWKVLLDYGIEYPKSRFQDPPAEWKPELSAAPARNLSQVSQLDAALNKALAEKGITAYRDYLAEECWFNIQGISPIHYRYQDNTDLSVIPRSTYRTLHEIPVTSGNIACTYGVLERDNRKGNFIRIWGYTPNGWKIILEVLKV